MPIKKRLLIIVFSRLSKIAGCSSILAQGMLIIPDMSLMLWWKDTMLCQLLGLLLCSEDYVKAELFVPLILLIVSVFLFKKIGYFKADFLANRGIVIWRLYFKFEL